MNPILLQMAAQQSAQGKAGTYGCTCCSYVLYDDQTSKEAPKGRTGNEIIIGNR